MKHLNRISIILLLIFLSGTSLLLHARGRGRGEAGRSVTAEPEIRRGKYIFKYHPKQTKRMGMKTYYSKQSRIYYTPETEGFWQADAFGNLVNIDPQMLRMMGLWGMAPGTMAPGMMAPGMMGGGMGMMGGGMGMMGGGMGMMGGGMGMMGGGMAGAMPGMKTTIDTTESKMLIGDLERRTSQLRLPKTDEGFNVIVNQVAKELEEGSLFVLQGAVDKFQAFALVASNRGAANSDRWGSLIRFCLALRKCAFVDLKVRNTIAEVMIGMLDHAQKDIPSRYNIARDFHYNRIMQKLDRFVGGILAEIPLLPQDTNDIKKGKLPELLRLNLSSMQTRVTDVTREMRKGMTRTPYGSPYMMPGMGMQQGRPGSKAGIKSDVQKEIEEKIENTPDIPNEKTKVAMYPGMMPGMGMPGMGMPGMRQQQQPPQQQPQQKPGQPQVSTGDLDRQMIALQREIILGILKLIQEPLNRFILVTSKARNKKREASIIKLSKTIDTLKRVMYDPEWEPGKFVTIDKEDIARLTKAIKLHRPSDIAMILALAQNVAQTKKPELFTLFIQAAMANNVIPNESAFSDAEKYITAVDAVTQLIKSTTATIVFQDQNVATQLDTFNSLVSRPPKLKKSTKRKKAYEAFKTEYDKVKAITQSATETSKEEGEEDKPDADTTKAENYMKTKLDVLQKQKTGWRSNTTTYVNLVKDVTQYLERNPTAKKLNITQEFIQEAENRKTHAIRKSKKKQRTDTLENLQRVANS